MRIAGFWLAFLALTTETIARPVAAPDAAVATSSSTLAVREADPAGGFLAGIFPKAAAKLIGKPKAQPVKWTPPTPQSPGTIERNLANRRVFNGPFARARAPQNARIGRQRPPALYFIPSNKPKAPIKPPTVD